MSIRSTYILIYIFCSIHQKLLQNAIPLSQLQASHVLNYEHKLIPVILTHCQYSLRYGKGTEVIYDFEAIERDLFDKFIFGKPLILVDEMPRVVFRKDAHDANFYESIMDNVKQACKFCFVNLYYMHCFIGGFAA